MFLPPFASLSVQCLQDFDKIHYTALAVEIALFFYLLVQFIWKAKNKEVFTGGLNS